MTKKIKPVRIEGQVAYIHLSKGYEAIIDADDVPLVEGASWYARVAHYKNGAHRATYAARTSQLSGGKRQMVLLHRVINNTPDGMECDHINGDGLDNRKCNLREATRSQNECNKRLSRRNSSGAKGVSWHRPTGKWQAKIMLNGEQRNRYFSSIDDAASWYAAMSAEIHGAFGRVA